MPTITVPEALALRLQQHALAHHQSVETLAISLLTSALDSVINPQLLTVVQRIQSTPPNPIQIRPAQGSLAALLHDDQGSDPAIGQAWDAAWQEVETTIHELNIDDAAHEEPR
ncbi:hypothetical protein [Herpetosiphon geysericola]|uniref:Uncharacterized protein n=1 Tax=Herpetosiphon geysericola TaxID=70996 RepID=A0A0P6XZN6_9CHLR|nr:hypothetical protein [Herpetosiphon geysericola]KPL89001.1 hypothetical protein SE18_10145 [Herpetosiphon geysericola]